MVNSGRGWERERERDVQCQAPAHPLRAGAQAGGRNTRLGCSVWTICYSSVVPSLLCLTPKSLSLSPLLVFHQWFCCPCAYSITSPILKVHVFWKNVVHSSGRFPETWRICNRWTKAVLVNQYLTKTHYVGLSFSSSVCMCQGVQNRDGGAARSGPTPTCKQQRRVR